MLQARFDKVMHAILWLKPHNHLYENIPVQGLISNADEAQES
jgi:hypothetical protein